MKGKLAIFSLFIVTLLLSCSNNTYKSSENTCHLYRTKINNVSQDENGNWVVKGVTGAPNGAKILVSNSDKDSLQYRENGAKSISKETFPKFKNKKFKCIVDPTIICDLNQDNKEGKRVKVLSFAITNYHKKWTTTEIPLKAIKIAKKHIRTQVLTISKSQEDYYNSFGKENKSSNNNYSISNDNIAPKSDYPNITDEFDISNMLQYSDEDLHKGVTIKNFYVKDAGADKSKDYHLLLTPKKK